MPPRFVVWIICLSTTNLNDLINYAPTVCSLDHILWTHVTSPFVNELDYDQSILKYFESENDSLMSVTPIMNFLYSSREKRNINTPEGINWPRTQDIETLYEVNSGIFVFNKDGYLKEKNRIGVNPYLYELDKFKGLDIDWEEDFKIAEFLFRTLYSRN